MGDVPPPTVVIAEIERAIGRAHHATSEGSRLAIAVQLAEARHFAPRVASTVMPGELL